MGKTKVEWEKEFMTSLVRFRDYFLQEESLELVGPDKAKAINNLILGYFCERRNRVSIKQSSCYMNNEDMATYINDVLEFMSDEHVGFLDLDWQQKYVINTNDIFEENEDSNEDYL